MKRGQQRLLLMMIFVSISPFHCNVKTKPQCVTDYLELLLGDYIKFLSSDVIWDFGCVNVERNITRQIFHKSIPRLYSKETFDVVHE